MNVDLYLLNSCSTFFLLLNFGSIFCLKKIIHQTRNLEIFIDKLSVIFLKKDQSWGKEKMFSKVPFKCRLTNNLYIYLLALITAATHVQLFLLISICSLFFRAQIMLLKFCHSNSTTQCYMHYIYLANLQLKTYLVCEWACLQRMHSLISTVFFIFMGWFYFELKVLILFFLLD
jgi:hypothetical protein